MYTVVLLLTFGVLLSRPTLLSSFVVRGTVSAVLVSRKDV